MHLLIPAAGRGRRMGGDRNKLLLPLLGQPVLAWTLQAAAAAPSTEWIGIMGQSVDFPAFEEILAALALTVPVELIVGGATRQESVYNGLQALPPAAKWVSIHDGARCLATPALFDRCSQALESGVRGLIAAVPVKDTIKIVDGDLQVESTPDRARMWAAQTPQGFELAELLTAHQKGRDLGWEVTDDAALFEKCGLPVQIVEGEETNLKVTTPADLEIATLILRQRKA
ncbi:MAG: 2-C-methyl-D-erythritol 4-phosphate cytidylyltransferase [Cyanobacteria bacterium J06641_5]